MAVGMAHHFSSPAPYLSSPAPYLSSPAPYLSSPAPYLNSPAPYLSSHAPYINSPAPYLSSPTPYLSSIAPSLSSPVKYWLKREKDNIFVSCHATYFSIYYIKVLGACPKRHIQMEELINMTKKLYPTDVLEQTQSVLDAINQINDSMTIGNITNASLSADLTQATQLVSDMNALEVQITNLRNQRDALHTELWDKLKRVRNGVKANYGDDSSEYEMVGGTRLSERKPSVRKTKPAA